MLMHGTAARRRSKMRQGHAPCAASPSARIRAPFRGSHRSLKCQSRGELLRASKPESRRYVLRRRFLDSSNKCMQRQTKSNQIVETKDSRGGAVEVVSETMFRIRTTHT